MRKILLFGSFVLGNFTILVMCFLALTIYTSRQSSATSNEIAQEAVVDYVSLSKFSTIPTVTAPSLTSEIIAADGRPKILDNFFKKYGSEMEGLGNDFVSIADRYEIPFNLVPAIAQCEGNLGKKMPINSFNPYGFGIYGDLVTRFSSWQEGIETVSRTLRRDYFDRGLDTPETIMAKYTPPSQGSWAYCVSKFMEEMK